MESLGTKTNDDEITHGQQFQHPRQVFMSNSGLSRENRNYLRARKSATQNHLYASAAECHYGEFHRTVLLYSAQQVSQALAFVRRTAFIPSLLFPSRRSVGRSEAFYSQYIAGDRPKPEARSGRAGGGLAKCLGAGSGAGDAAVAEDGRGRPPALS